ncbi:lipase family protein [Paraburkholderia sacchari]|uniref:lipase family protein n=1 Tax=Paraburkholderia sacchari TaxID=159450 RepID=UPI001BCEB241|nr:lipase family protein [Paraburkholderia sacchari]
MTPRDFALLAQEAYSAVPDVGIADSASRAIVRQTAAGLVVAFPGTDNLPCVGADINIALTAVPGAGDVHRGFWEAWKAISEEVTAAVGAQPVTLIGHSLGAAIAIMAAVEMTLAGRAPVAVYGFEPPRVSPSLGVRTLLANVHMVLFKNGGDVVPDLPLGWNHAALLTHIGKPALPNVPDHMIARVIAALPA